MTTGNGTQSLSEVLADQNCDSTVTRYVAVSTESGDNGAESSTIQIDITLSAENDHDPPLPATLHSDDSGAIGITIYNDNSGAIGCTPY
jgi:hypothetical protein